MVRSPFPRPRNIYGKCLGFAPNRNDDRQRIIIMIIIMIIIIIIIIVDLPNSM